MSRPTLDPVLIKRAMELIARGIPVTEAAKQVGVSRSALYQYGVRAL